MNIALITSAYPPGPESAAQRKAVADAERRLDAGHTVHIIAPALSRTPLRSVDGRRHVHRIVMPSPIVTRERCASNFSLQAARLASELHERGEIDAVDAGNDPLAGALLGLLRPAGRPPIRIEIAPDDVAIDTAPDARGASPIIRSAAALSRAVLDRDGDADNRISAWRTVRDALMSQCRQEASTC